MSRKEAILQAAADFFAERGFRESSMSEIARAAGVADGTVFYHFKTKEELYLAVLEEVKDRITQEIDRYAGEAELDSGLDMMEGVISFYLYLAGSMEERFLLLHRHDPRTVEDHADGCGAPAAARHRVGEQTSPPRRRAA